MVIRKPTFSVTTTPSSPSTVTVSGRTTPGATVTAENLSAAPFAPSDHADTFATTKADAQGRFSLPVPLAEQGDKVRLSVDGAPTSTILGVRLRKTEFVDGRRAEVGHQGLRLVPAGDDAFGFTNVRRNKRVGEPGAKFELRNARTGDVFSFKLDARGRLPDDATVRGKPGDTLSLHVSDGKHEDYMGRDGWGSFTIPAPGQPLATEDLRAGGVARTTRFTGPLFVEGAVARDAVQGQVGDCYMVTVAAAMAHVQPERLKQMFKENADGTVTVTFRAHDEATDTYKEVPITVDRELPVRYGQPAYGGDDGTLSADKMETWFAMLEKAYATWKGGYDAISCGYPYEIFEAFMGTEGRHLDTRGHDEKSLMAAVTRMVDEKRAVVCWTGGEAAERKFANSGLYGDHAYTIMGVEKRDGVEGVVLRNPWGRGEPRADARDDGVFFLTAAQFRKFFVGVGAA